MALRKLAIVPSPAGGLAAGAAAATALDQRLRRLEGPPSVGGHARRLTWVTAMTSVAVPIAISAGRLAATPFFC